MNIESEILRNQDRQDLTKKHSFLKEIIYYFIQQLK